MDSEKILDLAVKAGFDVYEAEVFADELVRFAELLGIKDCGGSNESV